MNISFTGRIIVNRPQTELICSHLSRAVFRQFSREFEELGRAAAENFEIVGGPPQPTVVFVITVVFLVAVIIVVSVCCLTRLSHHLLNLQRTQTHTYYLNEYFLCEPGPAGSCLILLLQRLQKKKNNWRWGVLWSPAHTSRTVCQLPFEPQRSRHWLDISRPTCLTGTDSTSEDYLGRALQISASSSSSSSSIRHSVFSWARCPSSHTNDGIKAEEFYIVFDTTLFRDAWTKICEKHAELSLYMINIKASINQHRKNANTTKKKDIRIS